MSTQSLKEILTDLDKKILVEIICQQAEKDSELKAMLLAEHETKVDPETKDAYKILIQQTLGSGEDRHGFIDYRSTSHVMRGVYDLLYQAESLEEKHEIDRAIPIAQAAIEVLVPALQQADDSNGSIGGGIDQAFNILEATATQLTRDKQEAFFRYCLEESQNKAYEGWDFHWQFLEIVALVTNTMERQQELFDILDKFAKNQEDDFSSNYSREQAAKIKLSVFEWQRNKKAIEPFLQKHLELDAIRMIVIEKRLKEKKFDEVRQLCADGIHLAEAHKWPGTVGQYKKILLEIEKNK